jgi:hypothetical protein
MIVPSSRVSASTTVAAIFVLQCGNVLQFCQSDLHCPFVRFSSWPMTAVLSPLVLNHARYMNVKLVPVSPRKVIHEGQSVCQLNFHRSDVSHDFEPAKSTHQGETGYIRITSTDGTIHLIALSCQKHHAQLPCLTHQRTTNHNHSRCREIELIY